MGKGGKLLEEHKVWGVVWRIVIAIEGKIFKNGG